VVRSKVQVIDRVSTIARVAKPKIQQSLTNTYMFREIDALYCILTWLARPREVALEMVRYVHYGVIIIIDLTSTLRALHLEQAPTSLSNATFLRRSGSKARLVLLCSDWLVRTGKHPIWSESLRFFWVRFNGAEGSSILERAFFIQTIVVTLELDGVSSN
jgi:hypothetical protein